MPQQEQVLLQNLMVQFNTLDSRMRVITQRMKIIDKNEQIIGKTLVGHKKKIDELEKGIIGSVPGAADSTELSGMKEDMAKSQEDVSSALETLRAELVETKQALDRMRDEVNEMKYVLDTINPMAYVTIDQVADLVDEHIRRKKA